jgi:group I intron endonuclease
MDAKDTIMGVVYIAINKINNKVYVGQSFNFKKRKRQHITSALNGLDYPFYKAIRKYGKENFEWRIICECSEQSLLNKAEQVFIDYYGGINSKKNYNAKDGGYRGTLCEESRKKIGNSNKGKKRTIEVKNKLSEMRRGRILNKDISGDKNPMFGKHHSDETKQKIRKALKGAEAPHIKNMLPTNGFIEPESPLWPWDQNKNRQ